MPKAGSWIFPDHHDLPGSFKDIDDAEDGGQGDSSLGKAIDFLLRDSFASIGDLQVVNDLIHRHSIGVSDPGFEDIRHVTLGRDEPIHRSVKIRCG